MTDYVKIKAPEIIYGETNLLQSQLNLINLLKQCKEYEKLRKEEILLKIKLKKKIGEAKEFLERLSKVLPESRFLEKRRKEEEMQKEITKKIEKAVQKSKKREWKYWKEGKPKEPEEPQEPKERKLSLDQELEEIKKKLEKLQ